MQQDEKAPRSRGSEGIESYEYPAAPDAGGKPLWSGWENVPEEKSAAETPGLKPGKAGESASGADFERRLAEETRKSFESGRERGRQEGAEAERRTQTAQQAVQEAERRRQSAALVESLVSERDRFLRAVEQEVVKLALAVAARILRREAQMDPLLLSGAVRVALGQLADSTEVRLRVPPADLSMWTEAMALVPNLAVKPQVVAAEGMRLGDCKIETALGTVDLGIRQQLAEIERGFFDRAAGMGREGSAGRLPPAGAGTEAEA